MSEYTYTHVNLVLYKRTPWMHMQTTLEQEPAAMESFYFKLSLLGILIPCVLVATSIVAETTGDDELRTFIVRVQPSEKHVFAIPDDRTAWYRSFPGPVLSVQRPGAKIGRWAL